MKENSTIFSRTRLMNVAVSLCVSTLVTLIGCNSEEANLEPYPTNLGSAESPLLPRTTMIVNDDLLAGRADLIPAANADELGDPNDPHAADRRSISKLIDSIKSAVQNKDFTALAELSVQQQRTVLEATTDKMMAVENALDQLIAAVEQADPKPAGAEELVALLVANRDLPFTSDDVAFEGDDLATVQKGVQTYKFHRTDQGWLIEMPGVAPIAAMQEGLLTAAETQINGIKTLIEDSSQPADQREAQITGLLNTLKAQLGQSENG